MTHKDNQRLCGSRVYNASNCHSKIRKVAENRFETIYLCGKHAFNYSIVTKNNATNTLKEVTYPNRNAALVAFAVAIKKYD